MVEFKILFLLAVVVLLSGCINLSSGPASFYSNDVISIENYVLTDSQPVPGGTTSIKFDLRNNGQDPVPRVVVNFFDTQGLSTSVNCNGGTKLSGSSCEYDNIPSLNTRSFSITFNIPGKSDIQGPISLNFNYEIDYDYHGSRRIVLPVIDTSQETQPITQYTISDPSVGPISADFDPPIGRTTQNSNNQPVQEYWGAKGDSFEIKTHFNLVASNTIGTIVPVTLKTGHVKLQLGGISVDSSRRCDFSGSTGTISSTFDVTASGDTNTLVCSFRASSFSTPEKIVSVDALFDYTMQIFRSATVMVTPQKNVGGGTSGSGQNV